MNANCIVCLIVTFVCLLRALPELFRTALSCIGHDVVVWSEYLDTNTLGFSFRRENSTNLVDAIAENITDSLTQSVVNLKVDKAPASLFVKRGT